MSCTVGVVWKEEELLSVLGDRLSRHFHLMCGRVLVNNNSMCLSLTKYCDLSGTMASLRERERERERESQEYRTQTIIYM